MSRPKKSMARGLNMNSMAAPKMMSKCAPPEKSRMVISKCAPPKSSSTKGFFGSIGQGIKDIFSSNKDGCAAPTNNLCSVDSMNSIDQSCKSNDIFEDMMQCKADNFNAMEEEGICYSKKPEKKSNKIINSKDVFSYRGIDGNWEYSNNLLSLLGIDDSQLEQLNTLLKENFDKNVLITLIALATFKQIQQNLVLKTKL